MIFDSKVHRLHSNIMEKETGLTLDSQRAVILYKLPSGHYWAIMLLILE